MAAEITTIHGGRVPDEPSAAIIETLDRLMDKARRGELIGLAYATVSQGDVQGTGWDGEAGSRHSLGTAVSMLQHRYVAALLEGE